MTYSQEEKIGKVSPVRGSYNSWEAVASYREANNRVNISSENRGALKFARGIGFGTRENYFEGYYGFGVDPDTYALSKNGYLDKVQRNFEIIA